MTQIVYWRSSTKCMFSTHLLFSLVAIVTISIRIRNLSTTCPPEACNIFHWNNAGMIIGWTSAKCLLNRNVTILWLSWQLMFPKSHRSPVPCSLDDFLPSLYPYSYSSNDLIAIAINGRIIWIYLIYNYSMIKVNKWTQELTQSDPHQAPQQ